MATIEERTCAACLHPRPATGTSDEHVPPHASRNTLGTFAKTVTMMHDRPDQIRDLLNKLKAPIPDLPSLLALVSSPLDSIGLLPPHYARYNTAPLSLAVNVSRHVPPIQRTLLEHIIPSWEAVLSQAQLTSLVEQWFIPDSFSYAKPAAGEVAAHAYASILSLPLTSYSINLLARLTKAYPVDRLHSCAFPRGDVHSSPKQSMIEWEYIVRNILSVPARVANALEGKGECPKVLEPDTYAAQLCIKSEVLFWKLSQQQANGVHIFIAESLPLITPRNHAIGDLLAHETRKYRCISYVQTDLSTATLLLRVHPPHYQGASFKRRYRRGIIFRILDFTP